MKNLNQELPIKNYVQIEAGWRGYFNHGFICAQQTRSLDVTRDEFFDEQLEMNKELGRIMSMVDTKNKFAELTNGEAANYWSETEHFYFWTRLNETTEDYCLYVKAYRKG